MKANKKLQQIDWAEFRRKHKNDTQKAFEDLCYFLFCREYKLTDGVFGYKNQTGIEKEPIFFKKKWIGFQAKFFDNSINWADIKESIEKAKRKNVDLQIIRLYINLELSESSEKTRKKSKNQEDIEKFAEEKSVEIEWFSPSQFTIALNKPGNLDLAQLYFGLGDEFGFIKDSVDSEVQTFLQSPAHINLSIIDDNNKKITNLAGAILKAKNKIILISGHPGCGKTYLIHDLFRRFAGLDKSTIQAQRKTLQTNKALPMRIDLKLCVDESLESIIRGRQNDYTLRKNNIGFIYLFDGLDELKPEKTEYTLTYIANLLNASDTAKIILSCRSGNFNRLKARLYFPNINEYLISDLRIEDIDRYFSQRGDRAKIKKLNFLEKKNQQLIDDIQDVLLMQLLWETIKSLKEESTIFDLISQKINLLLNSPFHIKNLESLNLLDYKKESILGINRAIAFEFQKKFQFRFPKKDLQRVIMEQLPRCDYRSTNEIIAYLSSLFFGNVYATDQSEESFIYQHRRYQEFFFTQKLKEEYEKNPRILRQVNILTNREFLERLFFQYLRHRYEKDQNIVGLLDINLIDVYLGNHSGYGVEDAYHWNSSDLFPALVRQNEVVFNELWNNQDFGLRKHFFLQKSIAELKKTFEKWKKDKSDYRANDYLIGMWSSGLGSIIETITLLIGAKKEDIVEDLLKTFNYIRSLYKKYRFLDLIDKDRRRMLEDPFWNHWSDWLFIVLNYYDKDPKQVFEKLIRGNYKNIEEPDDRFRTDEQGKERLVKGFYRALLKKSPSQLLKLLDNFDDFEFTTFLDVLCSLEYLPIFLRYTKIQNKIKAILINRKFTISDPTYFIGFYKSFFGIKIQKNEKEILEKKLKEVQQERKVDWRYRNIPYVFALLSYALNSNKFTEITSKPDDPFRYYNELAFYAALFTDMVLVSKSKKSIAEVIRDYRLYLKRNNQRVSGLYLRYDMSVLWAYIFTLQKTEKHESLISLKTLLLEDEEGAVSDFAYHLKLIQINYDLFTKITNESEIIKLESIIEKPDDYQSLVDDCFKLSLLFAPFNQQKARDYFVRGMIEGVLRHGWRKDTLVSYQLVDSLAILWGENFATEEELNEYARKVFALTLRVGEFTDGKGTWQGPYNVVELVAKYNLPLATEFKDQLIKTKGYYNFSNEVITSILLAHVRRGDPIDEIENIMQEYRSDYDYEGKPRHDVFEQKIKVYLTITESNFYTEEERKGAFEKAYTQVEEMKKNDVQYYLLDSEFRELKKHYLDLCKKFNKNPNVTIEKPEEETYKYNPQIEQKFVAEIKKANTPTKIKGLYRKLSNYKRNIVLAEKSSWDVLLNKTQKVCKNISPFIKLLVKNSYPHTDFYTSNSKYFHLGLAVAFSNPEMKDEATRHLYRNTGHGGFENMIKVYSEIRNKEMCRKLFNRYLQLCDLLSN